MLNYFLAVGAAWLAAGLIAFVGHDVILRDTYKSMQDVMLDAKTAKRRLPLYFLARLAFALVLVYLLRLLAPVEASWQTGLQVGALAGLLIYLPMAFDQLAGFRYPRRLVFGGTLIGLAQCTAAGVAAALVL